MPHQVSDVRAARADDHPHYARLFQELGVPEPAHQRSLWERAYMQRTLFIDVAGTPSVYGYYDLLPRCGYVRNIVVAPEHRGKGLGRAMMRALAALFEARGCDEWRLNVKADNTAAIALYKACGMEVVYRSTVLSMATSDAVRLPRPPIPVRVLECAPARDAAIEAFFAMPVGLLASVRAHPGAEVYELVAEAAPGQVDDLRSPARCLGVARFTASMPGAFPFRLAEPGFARPFLEFFGDRMGSDRRPVTLASEAEPDTVAALVAAGARITMEIEHMRGPLGS